MALTKGERDFHRKTAASCFNLAWDYLEKEDLDPKEQEEMLHLAHASRYHWGILGGPRQQAVGDWQLARVYAAVGAPDLSLQFALSSLSLCEKNHFEDLVPSAMEGLARAYASAGDRSNAARLVGMARQRLGRVKLDPKDRRVFESQINDTDSLIRRGKGRVRVRPHSYTERDS